MSSRNLDDTQSEILNQFQAITHTDDVDAAVNRLIHYDWNLERAVESVYDPSNSHDATREALEEEVASSAQQQQRQDTPSIQRPTTAPQPRTGVFALFAWPFGIAWNMTWSILSFVMRLLSRPSITHTQSSSTSNRQDTRTLAQQFKRDFELKFGETHVEFFQGGYSQALETARRDLRFLFVILQSDEHDDTEDFCRNTLTSQDLVDYMAQHNILVWAGNVRETEAFQVAGTLRATTYPFMAIIALQQMGGNNGLRMTMVDRIEGIALPATIIQRLERANRRHSAGMNRLRMERDQRDMERRLREEQDRAYRESLRADQAKERQAQEAREAAAKAAEESQRAEQARQELEEKREQYIRHLCSTLAEEPNDAYNGQVAKINFRLADGTRVVRKFRGEDTIEALYHFVEAYPLLKNEQDQQHVEAPEGYTHKYNFTVISSYPRVAHEFSSTTQLNQVKSLWPTATLIVEADDNDDDHDDDDE